MRGDGGVITAGTSVFHGLSGIEFETLVKVVKVPKVVSHYSLLMNIEAREPFHACNY